MNRYKSTKGISLLISIGSYGGFHLTKTKHSVHLGLAFVGITIFFYDVENKLAQILLKQD